MFAAILLLSVSFRLIVLNAAMNNTEVAFAEYYEPYYTLIQNCTNLLVDIIKIIAQYATPKMLSSVILDPPTNFHTFLSTVGKKNCSI
jgi:hypothetical protein